MVTVGVYVSDVFGASTRVMATVQVLPPAGGEKVELMALRNVLDVGLNGFLSSGDMQAAQSVVGSVGTAMNLGAQVCALPAFCRLFVLFLYVWILCIRDSNKVSLDSESYNVRYKYCTRKQTQTNVPSHEMRFLTRNHLAIITFSFQALRAYI